MLAVTAADARIASELRCRWPCGFRAIPVTAHYTPVEATVRLEIVSTELERLQVVNEPKTPQLLGVDFDVPSVRTGMDRCYRDLARATTHVWERTASVE